MPEESFAGSLAVHQTNTELVVSNDRIRVRLFVVDGGWAQEFHAVDSRGRFCPVLRALDRSLLASSLHRVSVSPMISGDRPHLLGACRESARMLFSEAEILRNDEGVAVVRLRGSSNDHSIESTIALEAGSNAIHVIVRDTLKRGRVEPAIEFLMSSYAFAPRHELSSPSAEVDLTWVPHLRPAPDHVIAETSFHSPAVIVQREAVAAALIPDVRLQAEKSVLPTALDLDIDNGLVQAPLLSYGFCGSEPDGVFFRHDVTMSRRIAADEIAYGYYLLLSADCPRRGAPSMAARFLWDLRPDSDETQRRRLPVSPAGPEAPPPGLVLEAPKNNGLFPVYREPDTNRWAGSERFAPRAYYDTAASSEHLYRLLRTHHDAEVVRAARDYADAILRLRARNGSVPPWIDNQRKPLPLVGPAMHTAATAMFLARLARVTGLVRYARAAESSMRYVIRTQLPEDRYQDTSLWDTHHKISIECSDPHSGAAPQSARAMLWVARGCLDLYTLSRADTYLRHGLAAMDRLCLMQSTRADDSRGMCAVSNVDTSLDAGVTVDFAQCARDYARELEMDEYSGRAALALAAVKTGLGDEQCAERSKLEAGSGGCLGG